MAVARISALAAFAVRGNLRGGLARGGALMGVAVMLVGPVLAVTRGLSWSFDGQFGFFGFLVLCLFTIRSGYQEQRELGLTVFFRLNVASPGEHAVAMVVSVLCAWAAACAVGFVAILGVSGGDARTAAWYTAAWGLRTLLLVGFVPMVEQAAAFRLPFLVPGVSYLVLLVAASIALPESDAIALFVPTEPGDVEALGRLGVQGAILLPTASATFVLLAITAPRVHRQIERLLPHRR